MTHSTTRVVVGVDTHADTHTAAVVDEVGRRVDEMQVSITPAGHGQLLTRAQGHGQVMAFEIEGSGSWGATLARYLTEQGHRVLEIPRPNRQERRRTGKSDVLDAEAAARVLPSSGTGGKEPCRRRRTVRPATVSPATNKVRG